MEVEPGEGGRGSKMNSGGDRHTGSTARSIRRPHDRRVNGMFTLPGPRQKKNWENWVGLRRRARGGPADQCLGGLNRRRSRKKINNKKEARRQRARRRQGRQGEGGERRRGTEWRRQAQRESRHPQARESGRGRDDTAARSGAHHRQRESETSSMHGAREAGGTEARERRSREASRDAN